MRFSIASTILLFVTATALAIAAPVSAQGYICAEGGGGPSGGSWAPAVFGWMVDRAEDGGGTSKVIVLGLSGTDPAITTAFNAAGATSVTFLNVTSANANSAATFNAITAADIVWMRGGDQWQYILQWNNTQTEAAIRNVYQAGGVVGGTSAGCAVLGELIYDAKVGSVTPKQALQNATHPFLTFTDTFLQLTPGVLFDTHFTERGRVGRLAVMLANRWQVTGRDVLGVGVDDRTALCVYPDLTAEVRGEGAVTFLHRTSSSVKRVESGKSPVVTHLSLTQLTEGYVYDLTTRSVIERPASATLPPPSTISPSVTVPVTLNGSTVSSPQQGDVRVLDFNNDLALFLGKLDVVDGNNTLQRVVLSAQTWNSTAFDENRVGGPQYAIALNPHYFGLYLDGNTLVNATPPSLLTAQSPASGLESAIVAFDSHGMTSLDFSNYVSDPGDSDGPRQSVAIEGARLHLFRNSWGYRLDLHRPVSPAGASDINLDGTIDAADMAILLGQWGLSGTADLDGSGTVDGADLSQLLGSWS
ncbi:MAG: Type 1 glutamine amidotransferase-like domain-containing protein [Phycisphaerae bacterium]|nr:Type 1 glutamine amidotransferase-like domain-containing protein [Phycisphaerae bacterium]MDZ4830554.1 Type 1 glutamine amidotransferase-like domain-containing protein [Phycisphaerae bacterium]